MIPLERGGLNPISFGQFFGETKSGGLPPKPPAQGLIGIEFLSQCHSSYVRSFLEC
jgi:hypothetical protein